MSRHSRLEEPTDQIRCPFAKPIEFQIFGKSSEIEISSEKVLSLKENEKVGILLSSRFKYSIPQLKKNSKLIRILLESLKIFSEDINDKTR